MAEEIEPLAPAAYNPIFETFVEQDRADEEQLANLVAYSLYKRAKVEWTKSFKCKYGRSPTATELTAYHDTWTSVQIGALRDRAWSALAAFSASVIEDAKPGILRDALRGKFWSDIGRAMFASFLYTLLLIAAVLVPSRVARQNPLGHKPIKGILFVPGR